VSPGPVRPAAARGRRSALRRLLLAALPVASPSVARAASAGSAEPATVNAARPGVADPTGFAPELRARLLDGGCILLMRHAQTVSGIGDPAGFRIGDCATQRNLSGEGRAQAERLGAALRREGVPIGPVRSSRWCRCLDTARLAFGRVEPWPVLDSFFAERSANGPAQTAELRRWALAFRGPGNAALVTHQVNVTGLTGQWVGSGELLVLEPRDGELALLGRLPPG
jgi:phosphohistidine phosphatase SixA